jgi:hypothetical protein
VIDANLLPAGALSLLNSQNCHKWNYNASFPRCFLAIGLTPGGRQEFPLRIGNHWRGAVVSSHKIGIYIIYKTQELNQQRCSRRR